MGVPGVEIHMTYNNKKKLNPFVLFVFGAFEYVFKSQLLKKLNFYFI